jgi:hypothetical protein
LPEHQSKRRMCPLLRLLHTITSFNAAVPGQNEPWYSAGDCSRGQADELEPQPRSVDLFWNAKPGAGGGRNKYLSSSVAGGIY